MITLNKLVYDIWEIISGGGIVDDSKFDPRQIAFWISNQRALLIRSDLNKGRGIDHDLIQDLGCVEMENADRSECCDIQSGCSILRTKNVLPKPIILNFDPLFTRIGRIDKLSETYNLVPYSQAVYAGNGRFNQGMKFAYYLNGRIYIKVTNHNLFTKAIKHINIQGVFENPEEVSGYNSCSGDACYTDDSRYPVSAWMVDYIKGEVLKNAGMMGAIPQDKDNNSDSSEQVTNRR
jgi:hypothetical protein